MAKPGRKERETEVLRRRVLEAAEDIFVSEGEHRVTMRRVAARVEYAPTLLYRLFADKNDLMNHLIARGYEGVHRHYEEVARREDLGALETLNEILRGYVAYALDHPNHYRMWFRTGRLRKRNRALVMTHGQTGYTVFQPWLDAIHACQEAGHFPGREPLEIFQVLWSRVHGVISLRLQHRDFPWMPVDRHLEQALDLRQEANKRLP